MNEIKSLIFSLLMVFALGLFFFPFFIRWQEKTRIGQKIKREGPNLHLHKENTPSMGGIIMILSGLLVLSFFQQFTPDLDYTYNLLSFAGLGLLDDYFKSFRGEPWAESSATNFFWNWYFLFLF